MAAEPEDVVVGELRAQLREAERLAQVHLRQAWQREDITRAERDKAIRRGVQACRWGQAGWNTARKWLVWHDDEQRLKDAAIRQVEMQRQNLSYAAQYGALWRGKAEAAKALAEEAIKLLHQYDRHVMSFSTCDQYPCRDMKPRLSHAEAQKEAG